MVSACGGPIEASTGVEAATRPEWQAAHDSPHAGVVPETTRAPESTNASPSPPTPETSASQQHEARSESMRCERSCQNPRSLGEDPMSELGEMMGDNVGRQFGYGGLSLGGGGTGDRHGRRSCRTRALSESGPAGEIELEITEVHGEARAEVLLAALDGQREAIQHCYVAELAVCEGAEGESEFSFIVRPTGDVQAVTVRSSTVGSEALDECVGSAIRRIRFPRPGDGGISVGQAMVTFSRE